MAIPGSQKGSAAEGVALEIYENLEKLLNTMKVLRGQEASLESSKSFYKGSRLSLKGGARFSKIHARNLRKSIKIHKNSMTSIEIYKKTMKF